VTGQPPIREGDTIVNLVDETPAVHRLFRQLMLAELQPETMEDILLPQTIESESDNEAFMDDGNEYDLEEDDSELEADGIDRDSGVDGARDEQSMTFSHYVRLWELPERVAVEVFARWNEQSPLDANRWVKSSEKNRS
jgi:hypothetical protein